MSGVDALIGLPTLVPRAVRHEASVRVAGWVRSVREALRRARRETFLAAALVVVGAVVFIAETAG
ncbi:hypothetical protein JNW90_00430 [Micromonospora sp. STR1s_5]|nr:hypothetical protein [Micromonospora sp. STR1s_5]